MPSESIRQLLQDGERSGLFSTAAVQELIAPLTQDEQATADQVAAQLVQHRVLTDFQAERLLAGRGQDCTIAGRYRILEKLGEGGMGAVYKAHDTKLDRDVAVKILPTHRLHDADAVARFQREARALARLSHANIIQAFDSGTDQDRHFVVMEFVEGASLAAILQEQGALPPTHAADVAYQAALGLQHAHEKGLIHRDIKPANLFLSMAHPLNRRSTPSTGSDVAVFNATRTYVAPVAVGRGIVKILDLGLARFSRTSSAIRN